MNRVPESFIRTLIARVQDLDLTLPDDVIACFRNVPRDYFVPQSYRGNAYADTPLPIAANQTISAPHMYAIMLSKEVANLQRGLKVLEVGTGSGYGAALLGDYMKPKQVITIERHEQLVKFARDNIDQAGISNVKIIHGDGSKGIPGETFDRIIVTATADSIPDNLVQQLSKGGIMVIPVKKFLGEWLVKVRKDDNGNLNQEKIIRVRFVPLVEE